MEKGIKYLIISLITAIAASASLQAQTEPQKEPAKEQKEKKSSVRIPFHGPLDSVDKAAMTITIGKEKKRTIQVTPETRILKGGKPATLGEAVVGEDVGGQSIRTAEGKEQALSLRLGPKPETPEKPAAKNKKKEEAK